MSALSIHRGKSEIVSAHPLRKGNKPSMFHDITGKTTLVVDPGLSLNKQTMIAALEKPLLPSGEQSNPTATTTTATSRQLQTLWTQLGEAIGGEAVDDQSGYSVSVSKDGNNVAIGAIGNDVNGSWSGHVRIYSWDGTDWSQKGEDLDGEATEDQFGYSVSISLDGSTVAVGANGNDVNGSNSGHVRIFAWDGTAWSKKGQDLYGEDVEFGLHFRGR